MKNIILNNYKIMDIDFYECVTNSSKNNNKEINRQINEN